MDNRLIKLIEVLAQYLQSDFSQELSISKQMDSIDMISNVINMFGRELSSGMVPAKYFTTLFDSAPNMVFFLDKETLITDMNKAVKRRLGYSKRELIGKPIKYLQDPDMRPLPVAILKRAVSDHQESKRYSIFKTNEKAILLAEVTISPVGKSPDGSTGLLLTADDLTPRPKNKLWENIMATEMANSYHITPRQMEVISLIVKGLNSADIGKELCISKRTVDTHRQNISKKTHTKKPLELLRFIAEFQQTGRV